MLFGHETPYRMNTVCEKNRVRPTHIYKQLTSRRISTYKRNSKLHWKRDIQRVS